ncbi:MAG: SUMF1/EgtB/PvdO family nonheme iron enzyme, partial [Myxococcota bacterium]
VVDGFEECDEGAENSDLNADACRRNCVLAFCGDGVQDSMEACDDRNNAPLDGCSPACAEQEGDIWITIPAGDYTLGSPEQEMGRGEDEGPLQVTLTRSFLAQAYEVTQFQWKLTFTVNPALAQSCGPQCPVERVNWYETLEYLNRLSLREELDPCYMLSGCSDGLSNGCAPGVANCPGDFMCDEVDFVGLDCSGYRLPTEAEWEVMARGDATGAFTTGAITDTACSDMSLGSAGWYCGNSEGMTHTVTLLEPNSYGLFDVHGNVREWTWDMYQDYPAGPVTDPLGATMPPDGEMDMRVVRGGSYLSEAQVCRLGARGQADPSERRGEVGFRPVRTLP